METFNHITPPSTSQSLMVQGTYSSLRDVIPYIQKGHFIMLLNFPDWEEQQSDQQLYYVFDQRQDGGGLIFCFSEGSFSYGRWGIDQVDQIDGPHLNDTLSSNLILYILQEMRYCHSDSDWHLSPMVTTMMSYLQRKHSQYLLFEENRCYGLTPFQLQKIESFVRREVQSSITTEELANLCSLSTYHFIRVFKKTTGETPHQYVNRLKMEKAKELLCNRDLSVIQIGFATGFDNPSHFSQVFKRTVGVTPVSFRKQVSRSTSSSTTTIEQGA